MDIYDLTPHKISIHAAREGGDICSVERSVTALPISIHAAREGGDAFADAFGEPVHVISIHAAREGGDVLVGEHRANMCNFNPRRP